MERALTGWLVPWVTGRVGVGLAVASPSAGLATARRCHAVGTHCTRGGQCCSGICESVRTAPGRRRFRCGCPSDLTACGRSCADLESDADHCGACGNSCDGGECIDGACTVACRVFDEPCGDDPNSCCADFVCDPTSGSKCLRKPGAACEEDNDCSDVPASTGCIGNVCTLR